MVALQQSETAHPVANGVSITNGAGINGIVEKAGSVSTMSAPGAPPQAALIPGTSEHRLHLPATEVHKDDLKTKDEWIYRYVIIVLLLLCIHHMNIGIGCFQSTLYSTVCHALAITPQAPRDDPSYRPTSIQL